MATSIVRRRPAETTTAVGAVVAAYAIVAGASQELAAALVLTVGVLPALVTGLVDAGGIAGIARKLWRGRS